MMYMLQLQNRDVSSYAGLYIDVTEIEAVTPLVISTPDKDKAVGATIYTKSGKVWNVHQSVSEVLDMISDYNEYINKGTTNG